MPFSAQHLKAARLHLMQADPVLKKVIKRVGPFTARMIPSPEASELQPMSDNDAIAQLMESGKSRLEAEEFLMFSLGRLDILPLSDPRLKTAISNEYDLDPTREAIVSKAATWKPYATIASWYLIVSVTQTDSQGTPGG